LAFVNNADDRFVIDGQAPASLAPYNLHPNDGQSLFGLLPESGSTPQNPKGNLGQWTLQKASGEDCPSNGSSDLIIHEGLCFYNDSPWAAAHPNGRLLGVHTGETAFFAVMHNQNRQVLTATLGSGSWEYSSLSGMIEDPLGALYNPYTGRWFVVGGNSVWRINNDGSGLNPIGAFPNRPSHPLTALYFDGPELMMVAAANDGSNIAYLIAHGDDVFPGVFTPDLNGGQPSLVYAHHDSLFVIANNDNAASIHRVQFCWAE